MSCKGESVCYLSLLLCQGTLQLTEQFTYIKNEFIKVKENKLFPDSRTSTKGEEGLESECYIIFLPGTELSPLQTTASRDAWKTQGPRWLVQSALWQAGKHRRDSFSFYY